jgi:hypothetical protein
MTRNSHSSLQAAMSKWVELKWEKGNRSGLLMMLHKDDLSHTPTHTHSRMITKTSSFQSTPTLCVGRIVVPYYEKKSSAQKNKKNMVGLNYCWAATAKKNKSNSSFNRLARRSLLVP